MYPISITICDSHIVLRKASFKSCSYAVFTEDTSAINQLYDRKVTAFSSPFAAVLDQGTYVFASPSSGPVTLNVVCPESNLFLTNQTYKHYSINVSEAEVFSINSECKISHSSIIIQDFYSPVTSFHAKSFSPVSEVEKLILPLDQVTSKFTIKELKEYWQKKLIKKIY